MIHYCHISFIKVFLCISNLRSLRILNLKSSYIYTYICIYIHISPIFLSRYNSYALSLTIKNKLYRSKKVYPDFWILKCSYFTKFYMKIYIITHYFNSVFLRQTYTKAEYSQLASPMVLEG